jgi:hypothetical protein
MLVLNLALLHQQSRMASTSTETGPHHTLAAGLASMRAIYCG